MFRFFFRFLLDSLEKCSLDVITYLRGCGFRGFTSFREVFKLHGQLNVKYLPYELEISSFLVASLNAAVVFNLEVTQRKGNCGRRGSREREAHSLHGNESGRGEGVVPLLQQ